VSSRPELPDPAQPAVDAILADVLAARTSYSTIGDLRVTRTVDGNKGAHTLPATSHL
jgi:hypothetical protein